MMATAQMTDAERKRRVEQLRAELFELTADKAIEAKRRREAAARRRVEACRFGPLAPQIAEVRTRRNQLARALEEYEEAIRDRQYALNIDLTLVRADRIGKAEQNRRDARRLLPGLERSASECRKQLQSAEAELKALEDRAEREWPTTPTPRSA